MVHVVPSHGADKRFYYFGEFGYFNFALIGRFAQAVETAQGPVTVASYPDYVTILKRIYPELVGEAIDVPISRDVGRKCHNHLRLDRIFKDGGYVSLSDYLGVKGPSQICPLVSPLTAEMPSGFAISSNVVSVFCRERRHDPNRNLKLDNWIGILHRIRQMPSFSECMFVFHGLPSERAVFSDVSNALICDDIEESIAVLNRSRFLVTSMSGFEQFALNCKCNTLQIGDRRLIKKYNPFDCIKRVIALTELSALELTLSEFE